MRTERPESAARLLLLLLLLHVYPSIGLARNLLNTKSQPPGSAVEMSMFPGVGWWLGVRVSGVLSSPFRGSEFEVIKSGTLQLGGAV